jgi:hypothetical protein
MPARGAVDAALLDITVSKARSATTVSVGARGGESVPAVAARPAAATTAATLVAVPASGVVVLRAGRRVHVSAAVTGWYGAASGSTFHPLAPATVLRSTPLRAKHHRQVRIVGAPRTGLPSNGSVSAVALTVLSRDARAGSAYALGASASAPATRTALASGSASHTVVVPVANNGAIVLRELSGRMTATVRVSGYFTADGLGGGLHLVTPSVLRTTTVQPGRPQTMPVAGHAGVPAARSVAAVVLAVTTSGGRTALTVAPESGRSGQSVTAPGPTVAQLATALGPHGKVVLSSSHRVRASIRVLGWYSTTPGGADVGFGCPTTLPSQSDFGVVEVDAGKPYDDSGTFLANSCFDREDQWAQLLPDRPQYYVVLADPGKASARWAQGGPRACTTTTDFDPGCAYDYGYEAAQSAYSFALGSGATAGARWWIDVERDNSWGGDPQTPGHPAANAADVRGALDYLSRHTPSPGGVYTTTADWDAITDAPTGFVDVPVWGGGAGSAANARANCLPVSITGGPALLTQWVHAGQQSDTDFSC